MLLQLFQLFFHLLIFINGKRLAHCAAMDIFSFSVCEYKKCNCSPLFCFKVTTMVISVQSDSWTLYIHIQISDLEKSDV